jgi:hypothetical protein
MAVGVRHDKYLHDWASLRRQARRPTARLPATSSPANPSISSSAAITGRQSLRLNRITSSFEIPWSKRLYAFGLAIHADVWMTNHIHLLATPSRKSSIGKTLQSGGAALYAVFLVTSIRTAVRFGRDDIGLR